MSTRVRLAITSLAAMALSAPTVGRSAMVADDIREATARGEYVAVRAPEQLVVAADYPRNRAERRAAVTRARRGAPGRRR